MKFCAILVFVFIFMGVISCNNRDKPVVEKSVFKDILTDIYMADAVLTTEEKYDNMLERKDSLSYYNYIFKKYNISRNDFYGVYKYYTENLEEFVELQQQIVDDLNAEYEILDSIDMQNTKNKNLWTLKNEWSLPEDGVTNSIPFEFDAIEAGVYELKMKVYLFRNDLSVDLRIELVAVYDDETEQEVQMPIKYIFDKWQDVDISILTDSDKNLRFISGNLLAHSSSTTYMRVMVKDIFLIYRKGDTIQ